MKLAVFLDHDIMIRHFLQSHALDVLDQRCDVVYVFPRNHKRVTMDVGELRLPRVRFLDIDGERVYRWRRLYHATTLRTARHSSNKQLSYTFWRQALGRRSFFKSWACSWPGLHWAYKTRMMRQLGPNVELARLLESENIDAVLHPTVLEGLFVSDLGMWAQETQKPVLLLMNSWDNPSTKAMTVSSPAWLVVWGEQSRQHAIQHLGWDPARVRCFGAAQFDVFRQPPDQSREAFLSSLGINAQRKVLLYAGSSKGLDEIRHLRQLDSAIDAGSLPACHILFRPHPWRGIIPDEPDFYSCEWKHVSMDPQMASYYRASRERADLMFFPDYRYTHTLLNAVDAVVSPVSTILLEAAMHGKPVLAYMPEEEVPDDSFIRTMASMNFMREFFERIDCGPCLSRQQFVAACTRLMAATGSEAASVRLRDQTTHFVARASLSYGEQVYNLLRELCRDSAGLIHAA